MTLEGRLCPELSQPDARETSFPSLAPGSQSQKCLGVPVMPRGHHPPPALVTVNQWPILQFHPSSRWGVTQIATVRRFSFLPYHLPFLTFVGDLVRLHMAAPACRLPSFSPRSWLCLACRGVDLPAVSVRRHSSTK